ncbi:hypothetical protein BH10BDE1_BH10BDE1_17170 [soil metagenome]
MRSSISTRHLTLALYATLTLSFTLVLPAKSKAEPSATFQCESLFVTFSQEVAPPPAVNLYPVRGPKNHDYHLVAKDAAETYERVLAKVSQLPPSGKPLLSIVMPAYREGQRLPRSLELVREFMDTYKLDYEVIVVVERSPDDSFDVGTIAAEGDPRIRVVQNTDGLGQPMQAGKGFAVRMGMQRANGRYRLFMDSDLSTSLTEILRFLDTMIPDATDAAGTVRPQMLIGSRAEQAGTDAQARTMMRELMSSTMRKLTSFLGRPPEILDTQCGFKMFTEDSANLLFALQRENGFAFDVELLLLAAKFQYVIQAQPVEWIDAPGSTVDPIKDSIKMLRAMLRIRGETRDVDRAVRRGSQ